MFKVEVILTSFLWMMLVRTMKAEEVEQDNEAPALFELNQDKMFKPVVALETWATYSSGEKNGEGLCDERTDVYFRRFRFGATGQPYPFLKYSFVLHSDRVGEDIFASTKGSYKGVGLLYAYTTLKLLKNSDALNLHLGHFWAGVSRDFITSSWSVSGLDRFYSTYYQRYFIAGTGNGITSGVALGGVQNFDNMGISYRVGVYEPDAYLSAEHSSRLYTGRAMWTIGDPEQTNYKYLLSGNQWCNRRGVTLGVGASTQQDGVVSDSLLFDHSSSYGADVLFNYDGLAVQCEYYMMQRCATDYNTFEGSMFNIRMSYNIKVKSTFVEPIISYDTYQGTGDKALFRLVGDDSTVDLGVNWYLNKDKLKLALHYVMQEGSAACNIGDYLGAVFQFKL